MVKTAYLLFKIEPPKPQHESDLGKFLLPVIKSVHISSQPGNQMSTGHWVTFFHTDADTYQEARNKIINKVRLEFPWLLYWISQ